jgi:hypothetical protein
MWSHTFLQLGGDTLMQGSEQYPQLSQINYKLVNIVE